MGRSCFMPNCTGNKYRHVTDRSKKLPAFFRFPKTADLFEKWKRVVPPRTSHQFKFKVNPRRYPTNKDYLCSLHFRKDDVIKYYEISSIKGCPKSEVVKIERGTWTLKPDAIPCYFSDDNPDAKLMLHEPRIIRSSKREVPTTVAGTPNNCSENVLNIDTETICDSDKGKPETLEVMVSKLSGFAGIDHNYHLPSRKYARERVIAVTELTETSTANLETNSGSVYDESTSVETTSKSDLYTVDQLHQDVLEIALPKSWTFVQNDDDYSTQFILYDKDMSVKSVKFLGSCHPSVTIRNSVIVHKRVNSKRDIEELLVSVSVL